MTMGSTFFQNKHISFLRQNEFFAPQMLYKIGLWVFADRSQDVFCGHWDLEVHFFHY
jgi:hypothetical protein